MIPSFIRELRRYLRSEDRLYFRLLLILFATFAMAARMSHWFVLASMLLLLLFWPEETSPEAKKRIGTRQILAWVAIGSGWIMILGIRIFSYWYAREIFRAIDEDTVAESSSVYSPLMPYLMMLGLVLVFTGIVLNSSEEKSSKTWRGVWKRFSTADLSDEKQEKLLSEIEAKNTPES